MRRPSSRQRRLVILLLAILTFGIAYFGGNRYSTPTPPRISGVLLNPAMSLPDFKLEQQTGEPYSNGQLQDHWSLLLLEPSPSKESLALSKLVQVHNRLASDPLLQQQTHFIYVVAKPTEEILGASRQLGSNFILLSDETQVLDEFFNHFGVAQTEHNSTLYLIDPDTHIQALFTGAMDAVTIADDLITLIANQR